MKSAIPFCVADLSFEYLGVRGGIPFDTSVDAAFATDEILIRALERFTIGLMATGAISASKPPPANQVRTRPTASQTNFSVSAFPLSRG